MAVIGQHVDSRTQTGTAGTLTDEDVFPWNTALFDRGTNILFIVVRSRGINMPTKVALSIVAIQ